VSLFDHIYEAAFVPELWPRTLESIAAATGSTSGALLVVDRQLPPLYSATDNVIDTLSAFAQTPHWYENTRLERFRRKRHAGFLEVSEFSTPEERRNEQSERNMRELGVAWQVASVIEMPEGETVLFSFERQAGLDNFSPEEIAWLDGLRPHLARASMMARHLRMERARASVDAMNALGIPAAVVTGNGVALSTNALFETMGEVLRPAAFGRIRLAERAADQLLQEALQPAAGPAIRSIPLRLPDGRGVVVHVLPVRRAASDIFDRGSALVMVTGYAAGANVPSDAILRGLFDLSAAEAGVAAGLAAGLSLKDVAGQRGIGVTTARSHLAQIFRKTGTAQQGQLVALLKGITAQFG